MHFVSAVVWLLADGCILGSSLRDNHHSHIKDEDNHSHNTIADNSAMGHICAAHGSRLHEPKATVDNACQNDNAAKPLMEDAQCTPSTVSAVIEMLVNAERGLEDNQTCNDNVADNLVVAIELVHFLRKYHTSREADNEQNDAHNLKGCMYEADSLRPWQIQCQGE